MHLSDDEFDGRPTPQKKLKALVRPPGPNFARNKAKIAAKADRKLAGVDNQAIQVRMVCLDKMAELDAIVHKDQSAIAMIAAIRGIQAQQWPKLVFHLYRPPLAFNEAHDDSDLWQTYKYTRGEVVSKLLDFVFLHIDICVALGRVEYKSLWAHTQIMETIPERILKFTDFLTSRGATRADLYDIIIKKWDDGENYLSWIEVFQIDTATLQEEEEVLDFRIW